MSRRALSRRRSGDGRLRPVQGGWGEEMQRCGWPVDEANGDNEAIGGPSNEMNRERGRLNGVNIDGIKWDNKT